MRPSQTPGFIPKAKRWSCIELPRLNHPAWAMDSRSRRMPAFPARIASYWSYVSEAKMGWAIGGQNEQTSTLGEGEGEGEGL